MYRSFSVDGKVLYLLGFTLKLTHLTDNLTENKTMQTIAENNVIRFMNISQKKEGIFANFKVKALKNGVTISASISVDIAALELTLEHPLERIVEEGARAALKELKNVDFTFEGMENFSCLGVAQLG